ncbi:hypothetical protein [Pseudaminobacter soli (ex Li et al. 2025)]|uniref:Flagellar protein n=1 Tax=Pseudaminobacter soli (ex Li et al. 2025) TaxID=1295366 RepID=A0A2P7SDY1_9HYPH|nr:hypothetical protein [Mesorhizobium soli]PSJ60683.1 hypothetical protein C7I85_11595 [Mesorhizobium soli]
MQLSQIEQTLQQMLEKEQEVEMQARQERRKRFRVLRLLERWGVGSEGARKADRRGDLIIAGMGITLGLVCALFPWYIFFNPDKFGVQALKFGGDGHGGRRPVASISHRLAGNDFPSDDIAALDKIDFFPTGTLPDKDERVAVPNQPFPVVEMPYRMVHAVNGRALIEDEAGLWVVQPGALLPDNSRVASIQQRAGKWIMVTSADKVVELSR